MSLYIILFAVILILLDQNRKLNNENNTLKKMKESPKRPFLSFCPKCGCNLNEYSAPNIKAQLKVNPNIEINNQKQEEIKTKINSLTKEEQKNNLILIIGAILIVLSAIIFLLSTWATSGNVTKTIIIFLMLIIFLAISKISESVFNLKQTAKVFFYISLCYLPISLLSISLFGLFGHYLSIYGSGKYIYFSLSCLITSIIYLLIKEKHDSIFLKTITEMFLYATIIFTSISITTNIFIESLIFIIYIIL
ncbi:MAG TPA: hypothetical protein DCE23_08660, partial [Firmicutes bacterium]|nr:hypothetical protein [Bacillota bacterium]